MMASVRPKHVVSSFFMSWFLIITSIRNLLVVFLTLSPYLTLLLLCPNEHISKTHYDFPNFKINKRWLGTPYFSSDCSRGNRHYVYYSLHISQYCMFQSSGAWQIHFLACMCVSYIVWKHSIFVTMCCAATKYCEMVCFPNEYHVG